MNYTLPDIQEIVGAQWLQSGKTGEKITQLLTDSRRLGAPQGVLFFALNGLRHNGHHYLLPLYEAGVRNFIVSETPDITAMPGANVLLVPHALSALQTLAAHHRSRFPGVPVIGITGSNGKTIVKEWLHQLLHRDYSMVRSPKSYNSQIGVPLSVWQMNSRHQLAVFEAGISRMDEMERLAFIIKPDIGIFTNIGEAHREGFPDQREKTRQKMHLFATAQLLIYCREYQDIHEEALEWEKKAAHRKRFCWSKTTEPADLTIEKITPLNNGSSHISGRINGKKASIEIPFTDAASLENAIHCWAACIVLGVPQARIRARMRHLEPVEMRLELKAGINRCTLINDAYNSDLISLGIALQFAATQNRSGGFTLILSDILQSGAPGRETYKKVAEYLAEYGVTRFIGIGHDIAAIQPFTPPQINTTFYPSTAEFLSHFQSRDFQDELILIKGARPFEFERITARLEQKAHKTVLEVNLAALVHNLNVYSRLLNPGVKTLVMVKASAYGSGAAQVAKLLEFHQVDYLGVAYPDEGIELREAGVQLPILVLNPEPASFESMLRYKLEPEVYSLPMAEDFLRFVGKNRPTAIHIKLDTGMHRLGFQEEEMEYLADKLSLHPHIKVKSVFSHLTSSDNPGHDDFTRMQAIKFEKITASLAARLGYQPLRHLLNTGGIARFPQYQYEMVRLGIGLYGIDSSGLQPQLQVVNTLKATVSQIKNLQPGESVGYNRNGVVQRPSRIATISVGYADGFLRLAGNGRYAVAIRGQLVPTIGNICMDMTMVDVTEVPNATEGDEVIVFGDFPTVQALADCLHTIPYEVFTNISDRVKRVYWQG